MKIDPNSEYDQLVFSVLKDIFYNIKQKPNSEVKYSLKYKPYNKDFYKIQTILDDLSKRNLFKVGHPDDVQIGKDENKLTKMYMFPLEVNIKEFNNFYDRYSHVFSTEGGDKVTLHKDGTLEIMLNGEARVVEFRPRTNEFLALIELIANSPEYVTSDVLTSKMNPKFDQIDSKAEQTIKNIKRKIPKEIKKQFINVQYHKYRIPFKGKIID